MRTFDFELLYYRPQTKFAKVMFLQVSVILSTGGGVRGCSGRGVRGCGGACVVLFGGVWFYSGGVCVVLFGGRAWFYLGGMCGFIWGGMHGFIRGGVHGFIRGVCMVLFGGEGACMVLFGGRTWFYSRGACVVLFKGGMHGFIWGGRAWFFQFFRIQWDTVNERAVRILLECILVSVCSTIVHYARTQDKKYGRQFVIALAISAYAKCANKVNELDLLPFLWNRILNHYVYSDSICLALYVCLNSICLSGSILFSDEGKIVDTVLIN